MSTTVERVALQLLGMGELMRVLGVSRTRTVQLVASPGFPPPVAELGVGKIWELSDVQRWADARGRTLRPLDAAADEAAGSAEESPRAAEA